MAIKTGIQGGLRSGDKKHEREREPQYTPKYNLNIYFFVYFLYSYEKNIFFYYFSVAYIQFHRFDLKLHKKQNNSCDDYFSF